MHTDTTPHPRRGKTEGKPSVCAKLINTFFVCVPSASTFDTIHVLYYVLSSQERLKTAKSLLDASRLSSARLSSSLEAKSAQLEHAQREVSYHHRTHPHVGQAHATVEVHSCFLC